MAIKYVKLGPVGTVFNSDILGIYLSSGNASEIDESLTENLLKTYFLTGFLVEISKNEYDNIKLSLTNARNIPLIIVPITSRLALEPVSAFISSPPKSTFKGNRYVVYKHASSNWGGKEDYITEFDGSNWVFVKPKNGMIVPVDTWGISAEYKGTYPSGSWEYDRQLAEDIVAISPPDLDAINYAQKLFLAEQSERLREMSELRELIRELVAKPPGMIKASGVYVDDANEFYSGNNVETVLYEIGLALKEHGFAINKIREQLLEILHKNLASFIGTLNEAKVPIIKLDRVSEPGLIVFDLDRALLYKDLYSKFIYDELIDLLNLRPEDNIPLGFTATVRGLTKPEDRGIWLCIDEKNLVSYASWIKIGETSLKEDIKSDVTVGNVKPTEILFKNLDFQGVMERIFYIINPVLSAPQYQVSDANTKYLRVIGTDSQIALSGALTRGAIYKPWDGVNQDFRVGSPINYKLKSPAMNNNTGDFNFTHKVLQGINTFEVTAEYPAGPQPLDRYGNNFDAPLPAGIITRTVIIEGVYPIMATTKSIRYSSELELQTMLDVINISFKLIAETETLNYKQMISIPKAVTRPYKITYPGFGTDDRTGDFQKNTMLYGLVEYWNFFYYGPRRGEIEVNIQTII